MNTISHVSASSLFADSVRLLRASTRLLVREYSRKTMTIARLYLRRMVCFLRYFFGAAYFLAAFCLTVSISDHGYIGLNLIGIAMFLLASVWTKDRG